VDQAAEEGSMERTLAWDDSMVGEQAVHGIWGFAKEGSIGYLEPTGGFSLWIGLRPYLPTVRAAAEHAMWQRILRSARVKILPGTAFACPEPGWFRLCRATDASTVATGINRLIRALQTS
jgi:bifunctional pyridoxal-dependent enzyme with beta-cystathionase and maltose regulon repressor activities